MAPTPANGNENSLKATDAPKPSNGKMTTPTIVSLSIFCFFLVAITITVVGFWFHRRAERNKLPPEHRPASYHPFRTNSSPKSGLLANAAPAPERSDDKASMFSRERSRSNVSLYVDTAHIDRRESMETVSLIPLTITPAEEVHNPMHRPMTESYGSSVSSSKYSVSSGGSMGLSAIPVPEEQDMGMRKTRTRSTSTLSARYYETTPTDLSPQLPIPKIVHTPSP
ncbi:hypothetical protein P154DRAFT_122705 [Amniculicola lignicola CBS 123094]|uniref:Uncharacterized protein n=1 Tax=Amniculicola lignicola CBS 123094 TaxID=1392246 RepID=A0A6A5WLR0_9PLEO|nr:hypothetical protein P154DRAFT_122705 [Amniculicola lignicola CBS 123094]